MPALVDTPQRILIVRPSALGDVCRSVPVLASLRAAYPDAQIDWMVQAGFEDAVRHHPGLSRVIPFDRRAWERQIRWGRIGPFRRWLRDLRRTRYDLVIDAQGLFRSAFFARVTGARVRIGYRNAPELAWLFYNRRKRVPKSLHAVDRMLALVELAGVTPVRDMRLYTGEEDRDWARQRLSPRQDAVVVLAPTSRWPGKQWPADRFAEVARRLLDQGVGLIAVIGGPGEESQCAPLQELAQRDPRVIDLVGKATIGQTMAVIERSRLVIANDSAPVHMAVGFNRPLVALYGPTRAERVGPYGRERDVIQHVEAGDKFQHKKESPGRAMMARITVEQVVAASLERFR